MQHSSTALRSLHFLTEEEQRQWDEDGYLHIRSALPRDQVSSLAHTLLGLHEKFVEGLGDKAFWCDVFDAGNNRDLSIARGVKWVPEIAGLFDHPGAFGKILGVMGPYIQVLGSELFFRYPSVEPLVDFHTDVGPSLRNAGPAGKRQVQIKAQFFLTDTLEPDHGNFTVVPGSHRMDFPGKIGYRDVDKPVQILAGAGDVVLFPLSLGHGVAPSTGSGMRVSVIVRYGQLFCRPVDYWTTPEAEILHRLTPRQRRLLGDLGAHSQPADFYGAKPDQLQLIYGDEWSGAAEAQSDFALALAARQAYEDF
jgi:hypothetical protein